MKTPALIDQSRDRSAVVSETIIRSLQAVESMIVEESLHDDVSHPLAVTFSRY